MKPLRAIAVALLVIAACAGHAAEITVSAAASLANAFNEIAPLFEAAHPGSKLQLNYGASGALLQQIARGAPVDVFASADQETMDQAQAQGLVAVATRRNFVSNTLVVIVPAQAARPPATLADLNGAGYQRVAIGLPASVPAGRYTRQVLQAAGQWGAIEPRMIGASNVRQALDYVARAEVDAGFVYATDAALRPGQVKVAFAVPTPRPILYPVAALAAAPHRADADRFLRFLAMPAAQAVLARYGFGTP